MGHQIHYASFETKTDRNAIGNECERYANRYGDGLPSALEFLDKTFDCYDDAEEYLEKYHINNDKNARDILMVLEAEYCMAFSRNMIKNTEISL